MRLFSCKYYSVWKAAIVASLFLCFLAGLVSLAEAETPSRSTSVFSLGANTPFAVADFDGDRKPDLATVEIEKVNSSTARYSIRFHLSAGTGQVISVTAAVGGLHIASRDVNGDNALDLVVATAWLHQPVTLLLNNGHGKFTLADPSTFSSAVWEEAETQWRSVTSQLKDTAVLNHARCCAGEYKESAVLLLPPPLQEVLSPLTARAAVTQEFSFSNRAPPTFTSLV